MIVIVTGSTVSDRRLSGRELRQFRDAIRQNRSVAHVFGSGWFAALQLEAKIYFDFCFCCPLCEVLSSFFKLHYGPDAFFLWRCFLLFCYHLQIISFQIF